MIDALALSSLLNANNAGDSSDDEPSTTLGAKLGPGSIGSSKTKSSKSKVTDLYEKKITKDIWDEDEVEEGAEFDTTDDPREQPEYDIVYKQKIATEDIYLGMSNKNGATSSCEDMIVKIKLPGVEKFNDIDLDLHEKFLDCRTTRFRLGLHLPHPVDPSKSSAEFKVEDETLSLTMAMNRDLDFINF